MATIWEERYKRRKAKGNTSATRSFSRSYYVPKKYIPLVEREWDGEVIVLESGIEARPCGGRIQGKGKRSSNARKAKAGV
jgi:hypothetical protein